MVMKMPVLDTIEDAVVQIFAQVVPFNWREPYSVNDQHEQRGTGFIIDDNGYIITSAHVINEAQAVWIQMPSFGQQIFFVDIIGFCPERDIALLRMRQEDIALIVAQLSRMPWLALGDSDSVHRTDPITVFGYPLGLYRVKSLTGVVSGWEAGEGRSLIQITAPVNPGNSGGPLIDATRSVIGVSVAAVFSASNVGYAIPINEVKLILNSLKTEHFVRRPTLGIAFSLASDSLANYLDNPTPSGLYISKVLKNSLAEHAGMREGDMLYAINNMRIDAYGDVKVPWSSDMVSLHDVIARFSVGDELLFEIYRKSERKEIKHTVSLMPQYPIHTVYPDYESVDYVVIAGMVVMNLTDNHIAELVTDAPYLFEYTRIERKYEPILVISHILPGSAAQLARSLYPGALIEQLNGKRVTTLEQFRTILLDSAASGFLTIKTKESIMAAFTLEAILTDELRLAEYFGYDPSAMVRRLLERGN